MRTLHINVLDKKATYLSRDGDIVCGNSDYMIEFAFDAEWDGYDEKTARFIWNGKYQDVKFVGTACPVPIVTHTTELKVGVYAGELSTTTSATIPCQKSILCDSSSQGGTVIINGGSGDGAGVPVPTVDDNGKVLTAEDGKAEWKEPTGGLPEVTAEDANKVLTANEDGTAEWKDPIGGGIEITEVSSPEEIPADAKEGSMWVVPKQGGGTGGNDGDTLTLAKQYTDEQITKFWTDAEVIDFTTMFDLAQSVMASGAEVDVETELAPSILQKMQNGPVKIKVAFNGMTATLFVLAQDFGTYAQFTDFVVLEGALLYLYIVVFGEDNNVSFRVQQVLTTPYNPS